MQYLWEWFCELCGTRQFSEVGALPITFQEIEAWARLTGNEPTAFDVRALKRLDYLAMQPKKKGK